MQNYKALKKSGNVEAEVLSSNEIKITTKQYDSTTGEEIDPKEDRFLKSTLEENLTNAKKQVEDLEALLKEFE